MAGERILIVASEPWVRERLREVLRPKRSGYDLRTAPTLQVARRDLQAFRPHVALIDIDLAEDLDGLALCHEIREDPVLRDMGVILLSRKLRPGEEHRALLHGADLCLLERSFLSPLTRESVRALVEAAQTRMSSKHKCGPILLCSEEEVGWIGDRRLALTPDQFGALFRMALRRGQTFSHAAVLGREGELSYADNRNVASSQVCKIRKELREHRDLIETVRRKGYRVVEAPGSRKGRPE